MPQNLPARTELVDTYPNPSTSVFKGGLGKLFDFLTGLFGSDGTKVQLPDGTLAAPVLTFAADTNTGFYRSGADEMTFVSNGVAQFKCGTGGVTFLNKGAGDFTSLNASGSVSFSGTTVTFGTNSGSDLYKNHRHNNYYVYDNYYKNNVQYAATLHGQNTGYIEYSSQFRFQDFASGNVVLDVSNGYSLALQGATSKVGTGITFPATQNPSSDPNTLDDFEKGSWTPSVSGMTTTGSPAYGGRYTKIGNQATVWFYSTTNGGVATYATTAGITAAGGLPFASGYTGANASGGPPGSATNGNTTQGGFVQGPASGGTTMYFSTSMTATQGISASCTYYV